MAGRSRDLIVHIGHPKTGSSAIQAFLGANIGFLDAHGVRYPATPSLVEASETSQVTSGNGDLLLDAIETGKLPGGARLLYSSELLFETLLDDDIRASLGALAAQNDANLKLICYTRDFFEFSFSGWGQYIKRVRGTLDYVPFMLSDDVGQFSLNGGNFDVLRRLLERCRADGIPVEVFNYERRTSRIVAHFLSLLVGEEAAGTTELTANPTINRSLTLAEYELQRAFNRHIPDFSRELVSNPLVAHLPDLPSERPSLTEDDYAKIVERYRDSVAALNAHLPAGEEVRFSSFEALSSGAASRQDGLYAFSAEQLDVLARSVSHAIIEGDYTLIKRVLNRRLRKRIAGFWGRTP